MSSGNLFSSAVTYTFQSGYNTITGGGADILSDPTESSSSVNLFINSSGQVVLQDYWGNETVMTGIAKLVFSDITVSVVGEDLIYSNVDGSTSIYSYNNSGEYYIDYEYDRKGLLTSVYDYEVTGQPYSDVYYTFSGVSTGGSPNLVSTEYDYSNQASGLDEVVYNAAGQLLLLDYNGTYSTPYNGLTDYFVDGQNADLKVYYSGNLNYWVNSQGQYLGSEWSLNPPANFSTENAYFNASGQLAEIDLFTNAVDSTTAPTLQEVQTFYQAGVYTGETVSYDLTSGAKSESLTYNSANLLVEAEYDNPTGAPYSRLVEAFSGGALQETAYSFTDPTSNTVAQYTVFENAFGAVEAIWYSNLNGSNTLVGSVSNFVLPTIGGAEYQPNFSGAPVPTGLVHLTGGEWTVTGGGAGDTFTLDANFKTAVITDFGAYFSGVNPDVVSVSTQDFANWSVLSAAAASSGSGANVTFTATNGDALTLDGVTLSQVQGLNTTQAAKLFTFHG